MKKNYRRVHELVNWNQNEIISFSINSFDLFTFLTSNNNLNKKYLATSYKVTPVLIKKPKKLLFSSLRLEKPNLKTSLTWVFPKYWKNHFTFFLSTLVFNKLSFAVS